MDIDERLAAITVNLELLSRDREDDRRKQQEQTHQIQALFLLAEELFKAAESHNQALAKDADAIRALTRIAENHERRLTGMEPPQ